MSSTMKRLAGVVAAVVLAGALVALAGCSASSSSSAASASASAASASASAASASASAAAASASAAAPSASAASASSEAAELANPWHDAVSAEEAAQGAGLEAFPVPEGDGDPKELVADKIGVALMNLNKIEGYLPDVIDDINAAKAAMLDCIEVC